MKVKQDLDNLGLAYQDVELGEIQLTKPLESEMRLRLKEELHKSGLELMDDKKAMIIEKIINTIVEMVHYSEEKPKQNFSTLISEKLKVDYAKLSELFSRTRGLTIERFIILHKIERVKELIVYDELSLSEIAFKMHYSSVAHLSNQFKLITGLTPTHFKKLTKRRRINLEDVGIEETT